MVMKARIGSGYCISYSSLRGRTAHAECTQELAFDKDALCDLLAASSPSKYSEFFI